jgi:hypothetical protein
MFSCWIRAASTSSAGNIISFGPNCWSSENRAAGGGPEKPPWAWNCCRVADLWWLVAGLRRDGICDLDVRLDTVAGLRLWTDVPRLTSLLGGSWEAAGPFEANMGVPEAWENRDGASGPMLERGLPCCDKGRIEERRFIHEPLEEMESLEFSAIGRAVTSFCLMNDCLLLAFLGGVS